MRRMIIEVPEEVLWDIENGHVEDRNVYEYANLIHNGTPLPEGHKKLIAEPTEEDIAKTIGGKNDFAECIRDAVRMVFINAPTIIKAESEVEDADSN